jgi:hypothetical protein
MKKALHIFAVNGKTNSGDFFLGPATKWKFEQIADEEINWYNFDVRKPVTLDDVNYFNTFDYVVVGGGGLLLPDTNPNMTSCWQWAISSQLINEITSKMYVLGLGWNLFYGQSVMMPEKNNNEIPQRKDILKNNLETLINKCKVFSMRHIGDCDRLKEIVDEEYHNQIGFELCPVIGYVEQKYKENFQSNNRFHTFEIKDDRMPRRYHKITMSGFYSQLLTYIQKLRQQGEEIAVMSHDGSGSFIRFLTNRNIPFQIINNTVANEEQIIDNYSHVKRLYCTAGHSQMMAHALDIDTYSLITHNKLQYFIEDTGTFKNHNHWIVNEEEFNLL